MSRQEMDYMAQSFSTTNKHHHHYIHQEIAKFRHAYDELVNYDNRSKSLIGIISCAWMWGSIGTIASLLICASYAGISHEFYGRPTYAKKYQHQLNILFDLYDWCVKTGDRNVITDKTFLKLTETIIPFSSYEDLKKPFTDWSNLSEPFSQILLQHPLHREKYLNDQQAISTGIFSIFARKKENNPVNNETNKFGLLGKSYAELKFSLYGRQTNQQQSYVEYAEQMLQPLLVLRNGKS